MFDWVDQSNASIIPAALSTNQQMLSRPTACRNKCFPSAVSWSNSFQLAHQPRTCFRRLIALSTWQTSASFLKLVFKRHRTRRFSILLPSPKPMACTEAPLDASLIAALSGKTPSVLQKSLRAWVEKTAEKLRTSQRDVKRFPIPNSTIVN